MEPTNILLSVVSTIDSSVEETYQSSDKPFIQANTIQSSLQAIQQNHIIPVSLKDNEPVISQVDFINITYQAVAEIFYGETVLEPSVRLSHEIKGRIPEAKNKPANKLLDHEKTVFFERMAFFIEIPSIQDKVDGNLLSLTVAGIKSYSLDNLNSKSGADQHFKICIGFKNAVCTNLCMWTDGIMGNLKVQNIGQLKACIHTLLSSYNAPYHMFHLNQLNNYFLTESQFANILGRIRMFPYLSREEQAGIAPLLLGEGQITAVVKDYYRDENFCRANNGDINFWKFYNLLTGANKSTYIDQFIERSINAYQFAEQLRTSLQNNTANWFLT